MTLPLLYVGKQETQFNTIRVMGWGNDQMFYIFIIDWCVAHRGCLAVVDCIYEPEVVDHSILQEVFRIMEPDAEICQWYLKLHNASLSSYLTSMEVDLTLDTMLWVTRPFCDSSRWPFSSFVKLEINLINRCTPNFPPVVSYLSTHSNLTLASPIIFQ